MNQGEMILTPEDAAILVRERSWSLGNPPSFAESAEYARVFTKIRACAALVPPPLNGDKVWSGLTIGLVRTGKHQNQSQTVVRAKSKAEAVRLLNAAGERISAFHFSQHWGVTGNREQLCAAKERGVYVSTRGGWVKK